MHITLGLSRLGSIRTRLIISHLPVELRGTDLSGDRSPYMGDISSKSGIHPHFNPGDSIHAQGTHMKGGTYTSPPQGQHSSPNIATLNVYRSTASHQRRAVCQPVVVSYICPSSHLDLYTTQQSPCRKKRDRESRWISC